MGGGETSGPRGGFSRSVYHLQAEEQGKAEPEPHHIGGWLRCANRKNSATVLKGLLCRHGAAVFKVLNKTSEVTLVQVLCQELLHSTGTEVKAPATDLLPQQIYFSFALSSSFRAPTASNGTPPMTGTPGTGWTNREVQSLP